MKIWLLMLAILFSNALLANQNIDWKINRLHDPEKITAGPWDNFGSSLTPSGSTFYYTQDKNQILSLFKHDTRHRESEKLTFVDGDVKQPVISATGKMLAYTYFGDDAKGDICLYYIAENNYRCITSKSDVDHSPFWVSEQQIGYLSRKLDSLRWKLVIHNISTNKSRTIAEGLISSPTASHDGQFILYNDGRQSEQRTKLYQLASSTESTLSEINLPGTLGFTAFSVENDYVYFSYYLNDTNFDQIIDAEDNSVIFRIPFSQWRTATNAVYPEQLTSVDYNCKYPKPNDSFLYLTCAFEGSLDIYRLPLTGMVPSNWGESQLSEAHLIARSYEQRLLLLNAQRYQTSVLVPDTLQRIIGNHIQVGEITAARYYISQLIDLYDQNDPIQSKLSRFYQVLDLLLHLKSEKNKTHNDAITLRFYNLVSQTKRKISALERLGNISTLAHAFIEQILGDSSVALRKLDETRLEEYSLEISKYLVMELYESLVPKNDSRLMALYPALFNDMKMSFEFRLYYAFRYLKTLSDTVDANLISAASLKDEKIRTLFQAEILSRKLSRENSPQAKIKVYKELSRLIKSNSKDFLLRRAMHVRGIQILSKAGNEKFMALLSRHWLTVSHVNEMEFYLVADQYAKASKKRAYAFMQNNQLAKAFNTFYPIIRQTSDLEAYYQFMTLGLDESVGQKDVLEKSLAVLKQQKLLGENESYTQALRILIEAREDDGQYAKALDKALSLLQSTQTQRPAAMHELLLGFIYHKKMQVNQAGYVYDKRLYQNAHYHYVLALDLARDNGRISSAVWQNLGWLHRSVGQYALATTYFQLREKYPFVNEASERSLRWALANSYFYNSQPDKAYEQMQIILSKQSEPFSRLPFQEKAAFYAMQAKKYDAAVSAYRALFSENSPLSDLNHNKLRMAYGYSLKKSGDKKMAIKQFKKVLSGAARLGVLPVDGQRRVAFNPMTQALLANGFLAGMVETNAEKIKYQNARVNILFSLKEGENISFDETARLSFVTKDLQKLSVLYEATKSYKQMIDSINQSLDSAQGWVEASGNRTGPVIYRAIVNYFSLAISHPTLFKSSMHENIEALYNEMHDTFSNYPYPTSTNIFLQAKAEILWRVFMRDVQGREGFELEVVLQDRKVQSLSKNSAEKFRELEQLMMSFSGYERHCNTGC